MKSRLDPSDRENCCGVSDLLRPEQDARRARAARAPRARGLEAAAPAAPEPGRLPERRHGAAREAGLEGTAPAASAHRHPALRAPAREPPAGLAPAPGAERLLRFRQLRSGTVGVCPPLCRLVAQDLRRALG